MNLLGSFVIFNLNAPTLVVVLANFTELLVVVPSPRVFVYSLRPSLVIWNRLSIHEQWRTIQPLHLRLHLRHLVDYVSPRERWPSPLWRVGSIALVHTLSSSVFVRWHKPADVQLIWT